VCRDFWHRKHSTGFGIQGLTVALPYRTQMQLGKEGISNVKKIVLSGYGFIYRFSISRYALETDWLARKHGNVVVRHAVQQVRINTTSAGAQRCVSLSLSLSLRGYDPSRLAFVTRSASLSFCVSTGNTPFLNRVTFLNVAAIAFRVFCVQKCQMFYPCFQFEC
jgi:hypothetical protein